MNQRRAKKLRRIAEASTENMPDISYEVGTPPVFDARKNKEGEFLRPYIFDKITRGTPRKLGYCTRKMYQDMKKLNA